MLNCHAAGAGVVARNRERAGRIMRQAGYAGTQRTRQHRAAAAHNIADHNARAGRADAAVDGDGGIFFSALNGQIVRRGGIAGGVPTATECGCA